MKRTPPGTFTAALAAGCIMLLSACAPQQQSGATAAPASSERAAPEQTARGAIELAWKAPKDRVSGAPLQADELAGYRIYIGNASGQYTRTIDIDDPQATRYLIQGLKPGEDYYLAITTIDKEGRESPRSGETQLAATSMDEIQTAESESR